MQDLLKKLTDEGYHLMLVSKQSGVSYGKLYRCKTGASELKESDIKKVQRYAAMVRISV